MRAEPLGRRQIETADRLVITKVDEADAGALASARSRRCARSIRAPSISGAVKGSDVSCRPRGDAEPEPLPDLSDGESALRSSRRGSRIGEDVDWTAFSVWLSALLHARGDDVLRVKGVVRTPAGRLLLQSVRKVVQSPEILPPQRRMAGARTTPSWS